MSDIRHHDRWRRLRLAAVMTTLMTPLQTSVVVASPEVVRERLLVRTYNTFGVSRQDLEVATATAREIFRAARIDIVWRDCNHGDTAAMAACQLPLAPGELSVRLVAALPDNTSPTLGYALVDEREARGTLCSLFVDRVYRLAASGEVDNGVLLGRAMAHELAHLVLGTNEHAAHRLMRARWQAAELTREASLDWMLSTGEGTRMRRNLGVRRLSAER
jgi:hypothetical protein